MKRERIIILVFILGLVVLIYPSISDIYYEWEYRSEIEAWEGSIDGKDYSSLWEDAEEYNKSLLGKEKQLVVDDVEREYVSKLLNPSGNGMMGYINIDKIGVKLPIYQGTEERNLQSGSGWWIGTSLPTGGNGTNCVITAHNGLIKAKMFTDLDKLELGDSVELVILDRDLDYKVSNISVVEPDDMGLLLVESNKDILTLYTCTPSGINTHRLIVRCERVIGDSDEVKMDSVVEGSYVDSIGIIVGIIMILVIIVKVIEEDKNRWEC